MQFGLGSYSFRWAIGTPAFQPGNPLTPLDLVNLTARLGCDLLQIADNALLDSYTPSQLSELKRTAGERSVTLEVGTSGATRPRLERYLETATQLNARLVRLVLDGPDVRPSLDEAEQVLRQVAPDYQQAGVSLAIENHFFIGSSQLANLIERVGSPNVGVCLDVANSVASQEWPIETVTTLAPYALNVHLKDFVILPHPEGVGVVISGAPLGEGRQDIPALLDAIPSRHEVNFLLEQWLPRQSDEKATLDMEIDWAIRSIAAARRYLAS
jgi:3-oxoisoapionate decarboxylase